MIFFLSSGAVPSSRVAQIWVPSHGNLSDRAWVWDPGWQVLPLLELLCPLISTNPHRLPQQVSLGFPLGYVRGDGLVRRATPSQLHLASIRRLAMAYVLV